jgi:hypothetical protein
LTSFGLFVILPTPDEKDPAAGNFPGGFTGAAKFGKTPFRPERHGWSSLFPSEGPFFFFFSISPLQRENFSGILPFPT